MSQSASFFGILLRHFPRVVRTAKEIIDDVKKQQALPAPRGARFGQSVIEMAFLVRQSNTSAKEILEMTKNFYETCDLPFVEVYETEVFSTSARGEHYILMAFDVLVEKERTQALEEMRMKAAKLVESHSDVLAYRVKHARKS